ncbi:MAG: TonB-dependent receptor [Vicinamibacteria bacterium]|nr:TonB-dependent receptor [Vicinamibacteria bacterium]
MRKTLAVLSLALALAAPAAAQFETATVLGTVRDKSGAVTPGVTVTLLNLDTGTAQTKVTDAKGGYEFFTVRIGQYRVTATLDGFAPSSVDQLRVGVGARQRVDLVLSPGGITEAVEVTADVSPLETDSSQRGQAVTHEQAVALPLNGRDYSALTLLTTGVRQSAIGTGSSSTLREGSFNVNGLRSTFNNFLLDGVDNNAYGTSNQGFSNQVMQPPPDALAEFKVVTNNMSAEYGRAGGATINVAYQSGTNQFKGALWEFFRDTSLNATGFFKPLGGAKPSMRRNQFGGVLGGPIIKNKAFFLVDYEGFRQDREQVAFGTIPTAAQRSGVLSVAVRNPITGITYPAGTQIPMTPFAAKVLAGIPDPTNASAASNYQLLQQFTNDNNKYNGKVDYQMTNSLRAFARFGYRKSDIFDQPLLPLPSGGAGNGLTYTTNKQFATGLTWTKSDHELVEFRFAWSRTIAGKNPPALGSASAESAYGITGLPSDPRVAGGLPTQLITGYADLGRQATNPQWQYPTVYNPKLNYTRTAGRHSVKVGIEFQHIETEVQDVNPLYGRDAYTGQFSRPTGASASNLYNLADFMFGLRSQYALTNFFIANLRQNLYFGYLQDDFRVNTKLTLNLGVRYEYATPQWERDNNATNFDPATKTMVKATNDDRYLVNPDKNNVAPRLGFAYAMDPKTVVRGGYGIAYIHFHRAGGGNLLPINGPQVITAVVSQSNALDPNFRTTQAGYPTDLTTPSKFNPLVANITYMPRDNKTTSIQSWFFSAQRELWKNVVVDLAYVGNRTKDSLLFANYNQGRPNNAAGSIPLAARRPIPEYGDITYAFNGGRSSYNSFQMRLEGRRGSLTFLSSLTISKAKDNGAGSLENPNGNFPAPQDINNLDAEFTTSAFDQPWNSTISVVWQLPFFKSNKILGGWQLAAINNMWAGEAVTFQYTPTAAASVSGIAQDFRGANNYRPNIVCDPTLPADQRTVTQYFNPSCVVAPTDPSQPFGNAPRNSARGDAIYQLDMALSKSFDMFKGKRLEFRVEAFNVLNKTNFRAPSGNRSSAAFGSITATYDPRQIQLGAKFVF